MDAKPSPIAIDFTKTVVIVVDMQNDFGSRGGMLDRAGIDVSPIRELIPNIARVINHAREHQIPIVYLKMGFLPDLSDLGEPESMNAMQHNLFNVGEQVVAPDGSVGRILIRDTWNTNIVEELAARAEDIVVYKSRFSGFYETNLDEKLRKLDARYLIVTGCTTSICVESTIRDAMFRGYSSILLEDCTMEPIGGNLSRTNHDASLLVIQTRFGWVSDSDSFIRAISEKTTSATN